MDPRRELDNKPKVIERRLFKQKDNKSFEVLD
jgi:hypothetical protein